MRTREYFWGSTYAVTEETKRFDPILGDAVKYHAAQPGFIIPYSWWMDQNTSSKAYMTLVMSMGRRKL